jgi:hypothetical protein
MPVNLPDDVVLEGGGRIVLAVLDGHLGPMKAVVDEEGHLFPRGVPVEVCTDTAAKLRGGPYASSFAVADGLDSRAAITSSEESCAPGSGCC